MSDAVAGLDLRFPIGGLFVALGALLGGFGLLTAGNVERYARSGGVNVNLWWGLVMLVAGLAFLLAARLDSHAPATTNGATNGATNGDTNGDTT